MAKEKKAKSSVEATVAEQIAPETPQESAVEVPAGDTGKKSKKSKKSKKGKK